MILCNFRGVFTAIVNDYQRSLPLFGSDDTWNYVWNRSRLELKFRKTKGFTQSICCLYSFFIVILLCICISVVIKWSVTGIRPKVALSLMRPTVNKKGLKEWKCVRSGMLKVYQGSRNWSRWHLSETAQVRTWLLRWSRKFWSTEEPTLVQKFFLLECSWRIINEYRGRNHYFCYYF